MRYVVEVLNSNGISLDPVHTFEAHDINEAIKDVVNQIKYYVTHPLIIEQHETSAIITTELPFKQQLVYYVGELCI